MSETNTGTVRFKLDPKSPPTMSDEHTQALSELRDEDINLSDLPAQEHKEWRRPGGVLPASQQALVLENDILDFFRRKGDASSERINAVLREYVEAHRDAA